MDYLNYNLEIDNIKNFLNNIETTKYFESRLIDDLVIVVIINLNMY